MSFITRDEIKSILDKNPSFQDKLYIRGFLITDNKQIGIDQYPFYGNWNQKECNNKWFICKHKKTNCYTITHNNKVLFLIGHAYNPFTMEYDEQKILHALAKALDESVDEYWERMSELTGVFCIGYIIGRSIVFSTDCTGMQLVYYGKSKNYAYITSHSKIFNDLFGIEQMDYIRRLVENRFYRFWGTWLPADLSPYKGIFRVQPNFLYKYSDNRYSFERHFPIKKIDIITEDRYGEVISTISEIMRNNLQLICKKWPGKRAAISVTGGRDSTMTLASACDVYEDLGYFSYCSNSAERVDAIAASKICDNLNLEHKIYEISDNDKDFNNIEIYRKILECNAGCIGHNNPNDVRKRIFFDSINDFDVEIKSWVDELSRGEAQNKYNTTRWPKKPTIGYYRCMWKLILNPRLIIESNYFFKKYLDKFYDSEENLYLPWTDLFFWEFSWSGGEGVFLTSEHRFAYDITIPYNNRRLLMYMFSIPIDKRLKSQIQIDTILRNNPKIEKTGVFVKNVSHTGFWSMMIRLYVRVFSKFQFTFYNPNRIKRSLKKDRHKESTKRKI